MSEIPLSQLTPKEQLQCLLNLTEIKDRVELRAGSDSEPLKPKDTEIISIIRRNLPKDVLLDFWTLEGAKIYTYKRDLYNRCDLIEELNLDHPGKGITTIHVCIKRLPRGGWKALNDVTAQECREYMEKQESARVKTPSSPTLKKKVHKKFLQGSNDSGDISSSEEEEEEDSDVEEVPGLSEHYARKRAREEEEEELPLPPPSQDKKLKAATRPLSTTTTPPPPAPSPPQQQQNSSPYLPPLSVPVSLRKHSSSTGSILELGKKQEWDKVHELQDVGGGGGEGWVLPLKEGVESRYKAEFFKTPQTVLVKASDRPVTLYTTQQVSRNGFILIPHDPVDVFTCLIVDPLEADMMVVNELGLTSVAGWSATVCVVDLKQIQNKLMEELYDQVSDMKELLTKLKDKRSEAELYIIKELLEEVRIPKKNFN